MEMKSLLPSIFRGAAERDPFRALQRRIDQVFFDFSCDARSLGWSRNGTLNLVVDVAETDKTMEISADLPGVDQKDISVTLVGDMLTIKAEKKAEKEEKGEGYRLSELSYGMFERNMELPFKPESSKVDAKFDKGVLRVVVTKPANVQTLTHKIPVKTAA